MHRIGDQFINTHSGGIAIITEIGIDEEIFGDKLYTLMGKRTGVIVKLDKYKLECYLSNGLLKSFTATDSLQPKRYHIKQLKLVI